MRRSRRGYIFVGVIDRPGPGWYSQAMQRCEVHHVTIIGVGLLGGSIGLAIRRTWPGAHVAGVGRRQSSLSDAIARGCIHSAWLDAADCVADSDLVILATPVCAFGEYLRAIAPLLKPGCLVTDVGSTKADVVAAAEAILGPDGPFLGSHPMAGTEKKGPAFASTSLLENALCVLTPTASTPRELLARAEVFWQGVGMRTMQLAPADHDRAVARISHLPHLLAVALMQTADLADWPVAATGFADMTRLAGGDPEMWRDIVATNSPAILEALDAAASQLAALRSDVAEAADDPAAIYQTLQAAQARRKIYLDMRHGR
jgi:prephenate dehydrogenase